MEGSLPAVSATKSIKLLRRGLSFSYDSRKLAEAPDKWHTFLKQLQERRRKIYKIVNTLHDHRLSEQGGVWVYTYKRCIRIFIYLVYVCTHMYIHISV